MSDFDQNAAGLSNLGMGPGRSKNGGLRSDNVSRLDLIVRWGGGRR